MTLAHPLKLQALTEAFEAPDATTGSVFFIGNATVLIRFAGFTILTDPTFIHKHEQVSLGYGLHSTRLTDPAIEIDQLPPLDFVLLSHFHGDHFDQVAEARLDKALPIVTTPGAVDDLRQRGFTSLYDVATWETLSIDKGNARVRVTATPGRHGPPIVDVAMPEVMGSVVEFFAPEETFRFRMYVTGDTLVFDDLKELPARYPNLDLALLHLGGTRVMGILVTMDAEQGVEMLQLANPDRAIPIHFDDYDVFTSPLSDFRREVAAAGWADRVTYLDRGEAYEFRIPESRRT